MEKGRKRFVAFLKYGNMEAEVYDSIQSDIDAANLEVLVKASFFGMVLGCLLLPLSFAIASISHNRMLYIATIVIMGGLYFSCKKISNMENKRMILVLIYLFLTLAFAIGLVMGTFLLRGSNATTFCVLLFALPLLLIDRPWRMDLMIIVSGVIFTICSILLKPWAVASVDLVNSISFTFLSIFVNQAVLKVKLRDLANTRLIEAERDTDMLTRLYSRNATETCIQQYMSTRRDLSALMVIDVDDFKHINDALGHQKGDRALIGVARAMRAVFRHADIAGRFGGDEFIVFLPDVGSRKKSAEKAEMLQRKLQEFSEDDDIRNLTLSIGIAHFPDDALTYKELFQKADQAVYHSKEKGKNCYTIYNE